MKNEEILVKLEEDMEMRGFSEYTKDSYRRKTKETLGYFKKTTGKEFEELSTDDVRKYLLEYLRKTKLLSERSVNYYNSVIRFVYEVTMDKIINKKQIPMYRNRMKVKSVLTKGELKAFFFSCDKYLYKTIFMLIYGSGLRISEAVNLKIKDIDGKQMRIFVSNGKGGKERYVRLPKTTLEMLRKYWEERETSNEEYIFLNGSGNKMKSERLRVHFRKYRKKAGLSDKFKVHSLRHSFATDMIERGASIIEVKELMGHSNIRSTMEYVHVANIQSDVNNPLDNFLEMGANK